MGKYDEIMGRRSELKKLIEESLVEYERLSGEAEKLAGLDDVKGRILGRWFKDPRYEHVLVRITDLSMSGTSVKATGVSVEAWPEGSRENGSVEVLALPRTEILFINVECMLRTLSPVEGVEGMLASVRKQQDAILFGKGEADG